MANSGTLIIRNATPDVDGEEVLQKYTGGTVHVYGLARNMIRKTAGIYNNTEVLGYLVEAAPSADDTAITPVDGSEIAAINKEAFTEGQVYPIHASAITVGTGGEFLLFIP